MENEAETEPKRTFMPRFSIRVLLALVTLCAFAFVVVGMAARGQVWAWGATIALASLVLTALVHAAWFGVVWLFGRMGSTPAKDTQ
jgi:hypothetical protein